MKWGFSIVKRKGRKGKEKRGEERRGEGDDDDDDESKILSRTHAECF